VVKENDNLNKEYKIIQTREKDNQIEILQIGDKKYYEL